jgi:hypothetical protein
MFSVISWADTGVGVAVDTGPSERPIKETAEERRRRDARKTKVNIGGNRAWYPVLRKNKNNR